jgi:hypothetical protein
MNVFTPRHLRKKYAKRGGDKGGDKKMAFRKCKLVSDKYIHQAASALAKMPDYLRYCAVTADGTGLRNKSI